MIYVCVTDLCMCVYQLYIAIILFSFSSLQPFRMFFARNDGPPKLCFQKWYSMCMVEGMLPRKHQNIPISSIIIIIQYPSLLGLSALTCLPVPGLCIGTHWVGRSRAAWLQKHVPALFSYTAEREACRELHSALHDAWFARKYQKPEKIHWPRNLWQLQYVTMPLRSALRSQFPERLGSLPSRHSSLFKESAIHQPGGGCDWDV